MSAATTTTTTLLLLPVQLGEALLLKRDAEQKAQQLQAELIHTRTTANQVLQQLLATPNNGAAGSNNCANPNSQQVWHEGCLTQGVT